MKFFLVLSFLALQQTFAMILIGYYSMSSFSTVGMKYTINCEKLTQANETDKELTISTARPFLTSTINGFWCENQNIDFIPLNIIDLFPTLNTVGFYSTNIKNITSDDFKPFGNQLTYIRIGKSKIEVLPADLFVNNPNLVFVGFDNNHIRIIHPTIFDILTNLVTLRLNDNGCIGDIATMDASGVQNVISKIYGLCWTNLVLEQILSNSTVPTTKIAI